MLGVEKVGIADGGGFPAPLCAWASSQPQAATAASAKITALNILIFMVSSTCPGFPRVESAFPFAVKHRSASASISKPSILPRHNNSIVKGLGEGVS